MPLNVFHAQFVKRFRAAQVVHVYGVRTCCFCVCRIVAHFLQDTLAEWLRRRPAKPMGSPCVGSNPTGVDRFLCAALNFAKQKGGVMQL